MRPFQIVTSRYRSPRPAEVSSGDVNTRDRVPRTQFHFRIELLYRPRGIMPVLSRRRAAYDLLVVQAVIPRLVLFLWSGRRLTDSASPSMYTPTRRKTAFLGCVSAQKTHARPEKGEAECHPG